MYTLKVNLAYHEMSTLLFIILNREVNMLKMKSQLSASSLVLDFISKPSAKQQLCHQIAAIEVSMTAT